MKKLVSLAESAAQEVSLSRRRFLSTLGRGAAVAAGVVASLSVALAAPRSGKSPPDPNPDWDSTGACFYSTNGIAHCQVLTESQCATYLNSDWYEDMSCPPPSVSRR